MGVDSLSPSRFFLPLVGLGIQVHLQVEGPLEQASLQMESSTYQALGFPGSGILSFGRTLSKQRNTPSRHRDAGEVLGDYPIPTGASQEGVPVCSLPRVLSHCLQDEILASTEGGFFSFSFLFFSFGSEPI